MRGGRARWKIENETFNTLKNQGYHFEHNYGHGKKSVGGAGDGNDVGFFRRPDTATMLPVVWGCLGNMRLK